MVMLCRYGNVESSLVMRGLAQHSSAGRVGLGLAK